MRVNFLLVYLFQTEDDLYGDHSFLWPFDLERGRQTYLSCVLVDMSGHGFLVDDILCSNS